MLYCCPFCGNSLDRPLNDGLGSCLKCNRTFATNLTNRLLSIGWLLRKNNPEQIKHQYKLNEKELIFAWTFVVDNLYSHDEFLKIIKYFNEEFNKV